MWCDKCKKITACKATEPTDVDWSLHRGRRWHRKDHQDVQWFRRGRICQECGEKFITAEVNEDFVSELVDLRDSLSEIRHKTEVYLEKSVQATNSLKELDDTLASLKALKT